MKGAPLADGRHGLAGIGPSSPLLALREQRQQATGRTQGAYRALFSPPDAGAVGSLERSALALRVAAWHDEPRLIDHYRRGVVEFAQGGAGGGGALVGGVAESGGGDGRPGGGCPARGGG